MRESVTWRTIFSVSDDIFLVIFTIEFMLKSFAFGLIWSDNVEFMLADQESLKELIEWYKKLLGDRVEKLIISNRLTTSPMAVVTGTYGYTANMERLMKAQALNDPSRYSFMASKKTVEINPYHPVVLKLSEKAKEAGDDEDTKDLALMLYDSALVSAGFDIDDNTNFQKRLMKFINTGMGVDADAKPEEPEDDGEEEEEEKKEGEEGEKKEEL